MRRTDSLRSEKPIDASALADRSLFDPAAALALAAMVGAGRAFREILSSNRRSLKMPITPRFKVLPHLAFLSSGWDASHVSRMAALAAVLLTSVALVPSPGLWSQSASVAQCRTASVVCAEAQRRAYNRGREKSRRQGRVAQVVQTELAQVIRSGSVRGSKQIEGRLRSMIQIVDVDVSPDLAQARLPPLISHSTQSNLPFTKLPIADATTP